MGGAALSFFVVQMQLGLSKQSLDLFILVSVSGRVGETSDISRGQTRKHAFCTRQTR